MHYRLATLEDLPTLNGIENEAAELFRNTKYSLEILQQPLPLAFLQQQQEKDFVWVATDPSDRPIGFAVIMIINSWVHLHELSVLPSYGRQGIGSQLVRIITDWTKQNHYCGITLSTFRDIPWNAPFYRQLGFQEIPGNQIGEPLHRLREQEAASGLPIEDRVFMLLKI